MTGSPVFRLNHDLPKKTKLVRKLNLSNDISEVNSSSNIIADNKKSTTSSLSSHVFGEKRGVKRKLDFDIDDASDTESSFRFSNRNINFGYFQSKNSSLIDVKSLASPSKSRPPGSYSRSSVGSTCRRRLFVDNEPSSKRCKFNSPLINAETKNEVKLSLKKKFPGVPNSDSARSGLLLNLAFSKYNLSSAEKPANNITYDFIGAKKDIVQYSSVKKDESSNCRSPVFTAIKKVKRKLNLEDQEINSEYSKKFMSKKLEKDQPKPAVIREAKENHHDLSSTNNKITGVEGNENNLSGIFDENSSQFTPRSKTEKQKLVSDFGNANDQITSPRLFCKPSSNRFERSDLFKNSKIRSSLRNKIFNLSKCSSGSNNNNSSNDNLNLDQTMLSSTDSRLTSPILDRKYRERNRRSNCDLKKTTDTSRNKCPVKYDRIVVKYDLMERTKKDTSRLKRLNSTLNSNISTNSVRRRWINDSFDKDVKNKCCNKISKSRNSFIESHIQRFLDDCMNSIKMKVNFEQSMDISISVSRSQPQTNCDSSDKIDVDEDIEKNRPATPICEKAMKDPSAEELNKQSIPVTEFIIEDANSQEISKQCVEEVEIFIESDSEDCYLDGVNASMEDGNTTMGLTKKCRIFEDTLDEDGITKSTEIQEIFIDNESEDDAADSKYGVEQVCSLNSKKKEVINTEAECSLQTPSKLAAPYLNLLLSSVKKKKKRRPNMGALSARLCTLINRENSEARMWEYELSKNSGGISMQNLQNSAAVFCIEKMWKEFSRLILVCYVVNQEVPDDLYKMNEMEKIGLEIPKNVVIIMDYESCPKTLNYSCTFRVHPPWRILHTGTIDPPVILKPCKIEMLPENDKPSSIRNLVLPEQSSVLSEQKFCSCVDLNCDCPVSEGYQTVISTILNSPLTISFPEVKIYSLDDFENATSIDDVVLKYKFYSTDCVFLDLRVFHVYKNSVYDNLFFWYVICVNEKSEVCCIVIQDKMKTMFKVNTEIKFRFSGLVPWKFISTASIPKFMDLVKLGEHCDFSYSIETKGIQSFVLSEKYGLIKRL